MVIFMSLSARKIVFNWCDPEYNFVLVQETGNHSCIEMSFRNHSLWRIFNELRNRPIDSYQESFSFRLEIVYTRICLNKIYWLGLRIVLFRA